ncbi:MAG: hypothetical protein G01um101448_215 [Parcubacteria group bacterium Gr01-1014_48]|nr:MAG: hypothetical protein Greene041614_681 [Parcubacteria group bacterium Greene0416_14]TSC74271.1 MAG: hypothetical protein G01um101448_215 [Parcubacteria group bacterium Gr01-1014_48]TSD01367.1 MAG: hypothetical protein Greene101415_302 [Parcubacteria group bacterium Greene1014_15]TSD06792.1 MAG: hypothetical protein Greene07144_1092 [Parcubacteria group bacterium Greene0714_4]
MGECAQDKLRQGLDLLWNELTAAKGKHRDTPQAKIYLNNAEIGLNQAEQFLTADRVHDASEVALQAGNVLASVDLRCAIDLFRESNELQKKSLRKAKVQDMKQVHFFVRTAKLLDEAESFLDDGKTDEAQQVLLQYHREKIKVGLAGLSLIF